MSEGGKEIIRHAIIGGLLMVVLLVADLLNHAYGRPELLITYNRVWIVIVLLGFVLAFALIWLVELLWYRTEILKKRRRDQEKIKLVNPIGVVDGTWIDVIWQRSETDPLQTSIIEIESTVGGRFKVRGHTFNVDDLKTEKGTFTSDNTITMEDNRGLMYQYKGQEVNPAGGPAIEHFGVGFYNFQRAASGQLEFSGSFMATVEEQNRRVEGRRLTDAEADAFGVLRSLTVKNKAKEDVAWKLWNDFITEKRTKRPVLRTIAEPVTGPALTTAHQPAEDEEDG